ncbi:MAG: desulfoferrodoxin family protein [Eubacteriales bacterium]|nr:desulfoferrodoxin family protein [Eubacteriales bacterium]MDY3333239.1 desulfoferrodoxin family protein [Gallibacter sp.]
MKKFYVCEHCGNIVTKIIDSGVPLVCCGTEMKELVPNTTDAAGEKHVPEVKVEGNVLTAHVGSVTHPMEEKHYIQFIFVETETGGHKKELKPGEEPTFVVNLGDEKPVAVYEYCNLHGLWKVEL